MIQVDKGVPLPDDQRGGRRATVPEIIQFKKMDIGDSFLMEPIDGRRIRNGLSHYCGRESPPYHYTTATEYDVDGKGWMRIWKTEPKEN